MISYIKKSSDKQSHQAFTDLEEIIKARLWKVFYSDMFFTEEMGFVAIVALILSLREIDEQFYKTVKNMKVIKGMISKISK